MVLRWPRQTASPTKQQSALPNSLKPAASLFRRRISVQPSPERRLSATTPCSASSRSSRRWPLASAQERRPELRPEVRICFVSAPRGSAFMGELLEVVSDAVSHTGVRTSIHIGSFPSLSEPAAYVVVPHEFFVLTAPEDQPTDEQLSRTIGFCVEHPGNATFEVSASRGARLGALFDINADSTDELRRRGLSVERFRLGYSPRWDAWGGDSTSLRPTDITYMGTADARRDQLLALQAEALSRWDCRLLLPPHEQMTQPRPDFLMGSEKLRS